MKLIVALDDALAATALAWTCQSTLAAPILAVALVTLAGATVAGLVLVVRWFSYTPSTPNWALAALLAAACLIACGAAAAWARSSRHRLLAHD